MTKDEFKEKMFAKLVERKEFKEEEKKLFMKEYDELEKEFGLFLEIVNEYGEELIPSEEKEDV
jgi:hypothetical protein